MFRTQLKMALLSLGSDEDGVLSFEWVLLVTLLTIGIVSGISAARDAVVDELGDAAQAMLAVDDSYSIDFPLQLFVNGVDVGGASDSRFTDFQVYTDCSRAAAAAPGQSISDDGPS